MRANLARADGKIIHRLPAYETRSRKRAEANFNGQCETRGQTISGNIVFRAREEDPIPGVLRRPDNHAVAFCWKNSVGDIART